MATWASTSLFQSQEHLRISSCRPRGRAATSRRRGPRGARREDHAEVAVVGDGQVVEVVGDGWNSSPLDVLEAGHHAGPCWVISTKRDGAAPAASS